MPRDPTPASRVASAAPATGGSSRLAALIAVALPAGIALSRTAQRPTWREDAPLLRDLGLVGTGVGGAVSTALSQAAAALPIGSVTFRASLVSVVALAVVAHAAFSIGLRLLGASSRSHAGPMPRWFGPGFAALGAMGAALGPSLQLEATAAGGAAVATALALVALALGLRATDPRSEAPRGRDLAVAGLLTGAATVERPLVALAAAACLAALLGTHRLGALVAARFPRLGPAAGAPPFVPLPRRALPLAAALGASALVVGLAPASLRPLAPQRFLAVGEPFASLPGGASAGLVTTALGAWIAEMGWVPLALAALGAATLLARAPTRPGAAALGLAVALDAVAPAGLAGGVTSADPSAGLRCLAVVALALAATVGLHESVSWLLRARVPYARPAAALLLAFQATVVALASEQASEAADRDAQRGSEEWLDASRAALEARSFVLVSDVSKATHLWAAQVTAGHRPDVVVAAAPLVVRTDLAADLLAREPRAHAVVRTLALTGGLDASALSELADVRSLHVEPDRAWEARVASHAELDGVWLHLDPQPIGRTDRKRSANASMAPLSRLLDAISPPAAADPATSDLVGASLREHALVLSRLGEVDTARALASAARRLGTSTRVASPATAVLLSALLATAPTDGTAAALPVRRTSLR